MTETKRESPDAQYTTVGPGAREYSRYAAVSLADGELLVYDRSEEGAWVQSGVSVGLAEVA